MRFELLYNGFRIRVVPIFMLRWPIFFNSTIYTAVYRLPPLLCTEIKVKNYSRIHVCLVNSDTLIQPNRCYHIFAHSESFVDTIHTLYMIMI